MSNQSCPVNRSTVLNYPIDLVDGQQALHLIEQAWSVHKGLHIITLNAEMVIAAQADRRLDNIIRHANLLVPDGAGVVLALRLAGCPIKRLPGIELAQLALAAAAEKKIAVALLGSEPIVLEHLSRLLIEKYPGLNVVLMQDGYYKPEDEQIIMDALSRSKVQLVLVAMGVPRQEYFIERAKLAAPQAVFIGVGGSFDVWAGRKQRAPKIFQDCHLEWLYRLLSEPWRIKRMGAALPKFAYQVLIEHLKKGLD